MASWRWTVVCVGVLVACSGGDKGDVDDSGGVGSGGGDEGGEGGSGDDGDAVDEDGDGFLRDEDCDDVDAQVNPDADEVCDGVDNDCDGDIDEADAVDASTWYADADGDGFGAPGAPETTCDGPSSGHVEDATDCDDTDDLVYPGAMELCDGQLNDCDDATWDSDAGLADFFHAELAEYHDVSATMGGDGSFVGEVTLAAAGTLRLCEGAWHATVNVQVDDVVIEGVGEREQVVLTASDESAVVTVDVGAGATVRGLTLTGGTGQHGGCVWVEEGTPEDGLPTLLTLEDTVVTGCTATQFGGGVYMDGLGELTITDSEISHNAAGSHGGGIYAGGYTDAVTLTMTGSSVTANESGAHGGGARLGGTSMTITDSVFSDNLAATEGGAIALAGSLTVASTDGVSARVVRNVSPSGGAVYHNNGSVLVSDDVDWGEDSDDNGDGSGSGEDIHGYYLPGSFSYGANASFTCESGVGCE